MGNTIAGFLDPEVDNSSEVVSDVLGASYAAKASVSLTIPTHWVSWKCEAYATFVAKGTSGVNFDVKLTIDGTDQQEQSDLVLLTSQTLAGAVGGRRTGIATTGARTVSLQGKADSAGVTLYDLFLYARAVRTG